jgi:hypothetical protein
VRVIVVRDGGAAAEGVARAEDNDREGATRDTQEVKGAGGVLARVVGESGVCGKGGCAAALVVRVDAEV